MSTTEVRKNGRHIYVLQRTFKPGDTVDLQYLLSNCNSGVPTAPATYLHVYCDTLRLSGHEGRLQVPPGLKVIRLIARLIDAPAKNVQISGLSHLSVIAGQVPPSLSVNSTPVHIDSPHNVGVTIDLKAGTSLPVLDIEPLELRPLVVQDYGSHVQAYSSPSELLFLVGRLFTKGIQNCLKPPRSSDVLESLAIFQFIVSLTRRSKPQVDLYQQASALVRRLKLPHAARLFVPSKSSQSCKSQLDAWIAAAEAVSEMLKEETLEKFIKDQLKKTGEDTVATIGNRLAEMNEKLLLTLVNFSKQDHDFDVEGLKDATSRRLRDSLRARVELQRLTGASEAQHKAFEHSVAQWQGDKEKADVVHIASSAFSFIFSIGKAIATEGQGIGEILSTGAALVNSSQALLEDIKIGRENDQKLNRLKVLGSLVCDFGKYDGMAREWNAARNISQTDPDAAVNSLTTAVQKGDIPPIDTFDFFSFQTVWDDFELENEMIMEELGRLEPPISGIDDCVLAVRKAVSRARLYIAAQKDLQTAQDKYIRSLMFASHLEQRQADLKNQEPVKTLQLDTSAFSVKEEKGRALLLEAVRKHNAVAKSDLTRWIVVAIYDWVLASTYENALRDPPGIVDLQTDLELSQYKINIAHIALFFGDTSKFNPVQTAMLFSTDDKASIFEKGWKKLLISEGHIRFRIPSDHSATKHYNRAFVRRAAILLHGIKPVPRVPPSTDSTLLLEFEFGRRLCQKTSKGQDFEYYANATRHDFETDWKNPKNVVVKAEFCADGKDPSTSTPALYSPGLVRFKGDTMKQWDFSTVTKVEVEIYAGYLQSSAA